MQLTTGTYTGDGIDNRWIIDPGFQPDLVIIKADASQYAVWRSSVMPADRTAVFSADAALFSNAIQAFGVNGFQLGTHFTVNKNGISYYWAAFRDDGGGEIDVGSYTGNGVDDRNLDIIGFRPTILWIKGESGLRGVWRVDENAGDDSMPFTAHANVANAVQTFRPIGFQVGDKKEVNQNGTIFYYVAFLDTANFIDTGTYTGNGIDNRNIAVGFEPCLVFVKGDTTQYAVLRFDTMSVGDSGPHHNVTPTPNQIQAFGATTFQVGTSFRVNQSAIEYYWAAWACGTSGIATTTTTTSLTTSTTSTTTTSTTTSTTTLTTTTLPYTVPPGCDAILEISDGETTVDLLKGGGESGYHLRNWTPRVADYKRGGIWQDSPLAEGRRLAQRRFGNVVETLTLAETGWNVDAIIRDSQDIRRLMEKASDYWWTDWQNEPVWLVGRAKGETNTRYAMLHRAKILSDGNPYRQPFMQGRNTMPSMIDLPLIIERGHWAALPPERSTSVLAYATERYYNRYYGNVDTAQAREPVANHIYVANKRNEANITHVFRYNAAPVGFSANLVGGAPYDLYPAVPAVGDIAYFGILTGIADSGPFSSLVFDLGLTHGGNITEIIWEYWDGTAWATLTPERDNTRDWVGVPFGQLGINSVVWAQPSDWAITTVNLIAGYWVRARISAIGVGPVPPQQQIRDVYTVVWPYLEVDDADIGGDIVALALFKQEAAGFEADAVVVGLRSMSRGQDFSAYLNFADEQNPPGVTVTVAGNCAFGNTMSTGSGREVLYTGGAGGTATFTLGSAVSNQYYGVYHAYLRGLQDGGSTGDTTFTVTIELGSGQIIQEQLTGFEFSPDVDYHIVDIGRLEISPPSFLDSNEAYNENRIVVNISGTQNVHLYNLVIVPIDEWAARFVDLEQSATSTNRLKPDRLLEFESVRHPKQNIRAILWSKLSDRIVGHYDRQANGPAILQANADQRLWVLCSLLTASRPELLSHFSVEAVQRYLSMRGNR